MRFFMLVLVLFSVSVSTFACTLTTPPQETALESQAEKGLEKVIDASQDASESTPEAPPQEPIPEGPTPLAWESTKVQKTLSAGRHEVLDLPALSGGTAPYQVQLETAQDGISLENNQLKVRLSYQATSPIVVSILAKDSKQQEAKLEIELTVHSVTWAPVANTDGPSGRANPAMALAGNYLLVLGGYLPSGAGSNDVWSWDRTQKTWQSTTASGDIPPIAGVFRWAVTHVEEKKAEGVVVQSMDSQNAPNSEVYKFTWEPGKIVWQKLTQEGQTPDGFVISAVGYDPQNKKLFLFGGLFVRFSAPSADLYSLQINGDKAVWTKHQPDTNPPGRYGAQFAMDEVNGRFFVVSGTGKNGTLRDAWWLDTRGANGPVWHEITAETQLTGRQNGALLLDVKGNRLFVWGGAAGGVAPVSMSVLCLDDPKPTWEEIPTVNAPGGRTSIYSAFDPQTGEGFIGFGRAPNFLRDVWSLQPVPLTAQ
ncbi:MAG: hypothetical protein H6728_00940 [Myxococcales bacterium]|nr:hypothetical protein [Myxococcales bacterium]